MTEELRALRLSRKIPAAEMVAVIQQYHPKFDKTMLSKCERGDKYGVRISRKAMDALYRKFAPDMIPSVKRERNGRHRLTKCISGRFEDNEYDTFLELIRTDGYEHVQDWMTDTVRQYIKSKTANMKGAHNDQRP